MKAVFMVTEAMKSGASEVNACKVLGISVRSIQRWQRTGCEEDQRRGPKSRPKNALSEEERGNVLKTLNSPPYRNMSPNQIVPLLADDNTYLSSESTMYRILRSESQLTHRLKSKPPEKRLQPSHDAKGPNQVWSWDITYLKTNIRGLYLYLYLAMDIWSRKIVGWAVHTEETMELGAGFVEETCRRMNVNPEGIVWHSDNGSPMKGSTMIAKLYELGLVPSFSRPRVSNDNPFSESLFRTLKYCPAFPTNPFAKVQDARLWAEKFVRYYNQHHLHSGIKFVTPDDRHFGKENAILDNRHLVYELARVRHPERWSINTRNWSSVRDVFLNSKKKAS